VSASAAVATLSHLTPDDLARLSVIALGGKFARIRCTLARWTRGETNEAELAGALATYTARSMAPLEPLPRKLTVNGLPVLEMPLLWREG
jgi:hypothetical protein